MRGAPGMEGGGWNVGGVEGGEGRLGAADAVLVVARVTGLITGAYLHG